MASKKLRVGKLFVKELELYRRELEGEECKLSYPKLTDLLAMDYASRKIGLKSVQNKKKKWK